MTSHRPGPREGSARARATSLPAVIALALVATAPAAAVEVPPGYWVNVFADGLYQPTAIAFGGDGTLYIGQGNGAILAARDVNHNGVADVVAPYATGWAWPLGLAVSGDTVYVSKTGLLARLVDLDGDFVADVADTIVTGLPLGLHQNNGIAFGPDGLLYLATGSDSNRGQNPHPWFSSILRFTRDGAFADIFATGFRNPYDLAFNAAGALFATDNAPYADSASICQDAPDELNWIVAGGNYGFPDCFGVGDCVENPECLPPPCGAGDCEFGAGCGPGLEYPIADFDPHASADGLCFGDGFAGFGAEDLFVAEYGNAAGSVCSGQVGRRVARVRVSASGAEWIAEPPVPFATGLNRPLDVAVGPDSALYVCDYAGRVVYRVFRTGAGSTGIPAGEPAPLFPEFRVLPNPARRGARIEWAAAAPPDARLEVFDAAGRRVAGPREASSWDLLDAGGARVRAGLYVVRVTAGGRSAARKLVVLE